MSLRVVRVRPSPSLPSLVLARSSTRVQGLRNAFLNVRHNTSAAAPQQPVWRRLPTVFSALLVVGVCSTAFGLYDYYTSFTVWPPELRADLRAGIKAQHQDDAALAERFLHRAYDNALALPASAFGREPHLKLSGLAVTYGGALEAVGRTRDAYEVYLDALQRIRHAAAPAKDAPAPHFTPMPRPSLRERLRAVALAAKLGEMAQAHGVGADQEEGFLTFAVEETLRVAREVGAPGGGLFAGILDPGADKDEKAAPGDGDARLVLADLRLPRWVSTADVGAPLEALGAFYARTGRYDYAMPLYLQATSLLIPPPPQTSPPEDRCRGAQMMLALASLIIRAAEDSRTPAPAGAAAHQAGAWVQKARGILEATRGAPAGEAPRATPAAAADGGPHVCEAALAAALFDAGAVAEMEGGAGPAAAVAAYGQAATQAGRAGMRADAIEAKAAARRVERAVRVEGLERERRAARASGGADVPSVA